MQKFFEKTIESDFIKSLLYYTPIPQYECVQDGDYVLTEWKDKVDVFGRETGETECVGQTYVYNGCIIKCTKSGIIGLSKVQRPLLDENGEKYTDETWKNYVEENEAEYEIIRDYNFAQYDFKITPIFHSTTAYYDSRTHYALGKFLRAYRALSGIDLMPYYNCYGYETLQGYELGQNGIIPVKDSNKTVYSVPICWNKKYLIHNDKLSGIALKAAFVDDENGLLSINLPIVEDKSKETKPIHTGGRTFNNPIEYEVNLQDQSNQNLFYGQRTNLRLLIQVNRGKESTLSVIETGNHFTPMMSKQPTREDKTPTRITVSAEQTSSYQVLDENDNWYTVNPATNKELSQACFSQSQLTLMNTGEQYAYTDTLIQYLLRNVICKDDEIVDNVGRVQKAVGEQVTDQWSDNLRVKLFNAQMEKGLGRLDIDGNVTKNVESMLRKEYSYKDYTLGE